MRHNQLKGLANVSSERLKNSQHQLEKMTSIYNKHIQLKEEEKNFYLNNCRKHRRLNGSRNKSQNLNALSPNLVMHLSIDAMKEIQIPQFGRTAQPNKLFFKRKLGIIPMGIFNEGTSKGIVYVYDQTIGPTKSSHLISLIDHYIRKNQKEEKTLVINFDNCAVNKNYLVSMNEKLIQ